MMKRIALLALAAMLALGNTSAQSVDRESAARLQRLSSGDTEVRRDVSMELYGMGRRDEATLEAIAKLVDSQLIEITTRRDPRLDETAWHVKALAASGNLTYMPLVERAMQSPVKFIAGHAANARETLLARPRLESRY